MLRGRLVGDIFVDAAGGGGTCILDEFMKLPFCGGLRVILGCDTIGTGKDILGESLDVRFDMTAQMKRIGIETGDPFRG